ncbi:growth inhibitor PemK [Corynebacterium sp. ES2794-CONJ1]|uniref:growth inhibitor PemK n=1 Tax=unclassified Corynebacterium TaxID=2624378 RepID=UPI00216788AE|nr:MULTISPECIES: growth inhibitor PemK [unclassified Corynebacterium]MCS4490525.1 growth inhibitor PemK [Corynebacterium sp. ES2775-CONJ]MCS4492304.1 growth inhibitor PemK [Corynebacterium sp. ES2715-CONJ3]MCS4532504.1 growth inhibitor PemK [Corynebacterium sp. ES2730-CONJ]MCU9519899.1 growth inhibitor PemK [Corynebacterium sp. ES2794-CONJ1]
MKPDSLVRRILRAIMVRLFRSDETSNLDKGLKALASQLGLTERIDAHHLRTPARADIAVVDTAEYPRGLIYAPNMDGQVDPGEVVFFTRPSEPDFERALIVVGRSGDKLLGLITSPNPAHALSSSWAEIGAGPWDETGRNAWARLDKLVQVPEIVIRRQGAVIPPRRWESIANRLRREFGWK